MNTLPDYTGLKDFARGVQKLYEMHGNVPVFISVDGTVAPFGIALCGTTYVEGQDAIAFCGHATVRQGEKYKKGTVTE